MDRSCCPSWEGMNPAMPQVPRGAARPGEDLGGPRSREGWQGHAGALCMDPWAGVVGAWSEPLPGSGGDALTGH